MTNGISRVTWKELTSAWLPYCRNQLPQKMGDSVLLKQTLKGCLGDALAMDFLDEQGLNMAAVFIPRLQSDDSMNDAESKRAGVPPGCVVYIQQTHEGWRPASLSFTWTVFF